MNIKEIKRLVNLVEDAAVSHLSVETDGMKIEIKKELGGNGHGAPAAVAIPQHAMQIPVQQPVDAAAPQTEEKKEEKRDENLVAIKSQMVGTFYASPNPDAAAYVKQGDSLKKGQVVCIIEAMKLFNEIESDIEGVVEKICVENASPVEYGQELFLVRVG